MCKLTALMPPLALRVRSQQRGSTLIVALVFLLAMTLIGVTAMQSTSQQESMAGNARERNLAFQAAESGLRAGERRVLDIFLAMPPFPANPAQCEFAEGNLAPTTDWGTFWMDYNWTTCGSYNHALGQVQTLPNFAIEDLGKVSAAYSEKAGQPLSQRQMFRITSRGVGGTTNAVAIVQVIYRI
ncbi:MAG: PilX N-terminal domain-containing pilus assembly protein [Candidatus Contendobacter sp.]